MLEQLKRVNALTFLVWMGCLVALVFMVVHGWTAAQIAATAGALLTVTTQLDRLVRRLPDASQDEKTPPGAIILPFVVCFGLAVILSACAAKEMEAEAAYGGAQYQLCVAPEPILGSSASTEERAAAWARVDACRAGIRERWGIVQVIAKDGGK